MKVAVIGGGIFGCCVAMELAQSFDVTLIERTGELLQGATYANHNRHHYGFHYPRSLSTAMQCLESRPEFERRYGDCLDWDFDNYYCISREHSKTTPADYLAFCQRAGLPYEEVAPPEGLIEAARVELCLKVREAVYDTALLRRRVQADLSRTPVQILLGHEVVGARLEGEQKVLSLVAGKVHEERSFDFVVNATYAHINRFCGWLGFPGRRCQFNLQELDVVELPWKGRIGVTVQDGPFPSIIPLAHSRRYLLAHVIESQLVREISAGEAPLLGRVGYVESNWARVLEVCAEYIPILRQATYCRSIFVDRVVDSACLQDDSRLTETTFHGHGCWSVFSAKVITCVTTAIKLRDLIMEASTCASS